MYALVSDFDGTISDDDFFTLISNKYFTDEMLAPWRAYLSGHKTHFIALNEMFAQIRIPETELKNFINKINFDKLFFKTCELCNQRNIPIYICSAGCDYYIKELIGKEIKKHNITLITNRGVYNPQAGLKMIAPDKKSPYYEEHVGISKRAIVEGLHNQSYKTIYAGDGPPDFEPAKIANIVFAKKILLQKCLEHNIKTKPFNTFQDVYNFIKELP